MKKTTIFGVVRLTLSLLTILLSSIVLFSQPTYNFTNAGASGITGPTQTQVNSAYTSTTLAGSVSVIGSGIQQWTVPVTGSYAITAAGAQGGSTPQAQGGKGRQIKVNVTLTAGTVLNILVGQTGGTASFSVGYAGGGGGGTFVINKTTATPLLISGGGGGAGEGSASWGSPVLPGGNASEYNITDGGNGTGFSGSWSVAGVGGTNGSGGTAPGYGGAGGGGYTGNGQAPGFGGGYYGGDPGISYQNGGLGGINKIYYGTMLTNVPGGFGGGAGAGTHQNYEANGGGGGGFSGGGGGNSRTGAGGGGGNYINPSAVYVSSGLSSGNGYVTITLLKTPAGALDFQGTDDYVDLGSPLAANASYTKEAWVYNNNPSFANNNLFSNYSDPVYIPGGYLNVGQGGNFGVLVDPDPFPTNAWTHVAVTYDQPTSTLKLYINGILKASTNNAPAFIGGTMYLGKHPVGGGKSAVSMDEVRLWSRALTSCEIQANMNCELPNPTTQNGLVRYYKFNQGFVNDDNTGITTVTDASVNNVAGNLTGFTLTGTTSNFITGQVNGTCAVYTIPTSPITGATSICMNGTTALANSKTGGVWSSSNTAVATVDAQTGVVTAVSVGSATITYTNPCNGVSTTTVTVAALPAANITPAGSTSFCAGGNVVLSAASYALRFNGSNATVKVSNGYASTDEITYEATVTPAAFTSGGFNVIVNHDNYNTGAIHFQFASGSLQFSVAGNSPNDQYSTYTFTPGNTYNLAAVYSKSGKYVKFYVNGVLTNTANYASTVSIIGNNSYYIGSWNGNSRFFNGTIDNIRIWNVQRSDAQLLAAANSVPVSASTAGLIRYYRFDEGNGTTTADNAGNGTGTLVNSPLWVNTTPGGLSYAWNPGGGNTQNITVNSTGNYNVTITNANNCTVTSDAIAVTVNPLPVVTISAGGPASFCTGGSTTLTANTGNTSAGNNLKFNGTSTYVNIPSGVVLPSTFTQEAWIYSSSTNDGQFHGIFGNQVGSIGTRAPSMWIYNGTAIHGGFGDGSVFRNYITPAGVITPNTWNHIAQTFDGTTFKCYVNGSLVYNVSVSSSALTPYATGVNYIGRVDNYFNGMIDEVRFWNITKTEEQIKADMNHSVPATSAGLAGYYRMDEGSGLSTADVSSGNRTGSLVNNPVWGPSTAPVGPSITWSPATGLNTTNSAKVTASPSVTTTYTATATDAFTGCASAATQLVTVNPLPTVTLAAAGGTTTCPGNTITLNATATGNISSYQWTKNGVVIPGASGASYAAPASGTYGVTVFTVDGCQASSNTIAINIEDVTPPVFTGMVTITTPTNADGSIYATSANGAVVAYTLPSATDNCSGSNVTVVSAPASGSVFPIGTTQVTYTATDAAGLQTSGTFMVTVAGLLPSVNCPSNITVNTAPAQCGANVNFSATETTGIPASTITYTENGNPVTPGSFFSTGLHTIVANAVNVVGSSTCSFTITVLDTEAPVLVGVPADVTVECDAVPAPAMVTASDNCSAGTPVFTETRTDGSNANNYTITRTWTVTDASENTSTATQVITVRDTKAPVISNIPQDIEVSNDAGKCGAVINFAATATDNCSPVTITYSQNPGTLFTVGTTEVVITATDISGNSSTAHFNIKVNDTEKPVVKAPGAYSVPNTPGNCGAIINNIGTPVTSDNCGVASISNDHPSSFYPVGTTVVTWTVTDIHGNVTDTARQSVTVYDMQLPVINVTDITRNADLNQCGANISLAAPATSDNCGVASVTNNHPSAFYPVGTTDVTWTVTDIHGNQSSVIQHVTVKDVQAPNVITKNIVVPLDAAGHVTVTPAQVDNGSNDNCSAVTLSFITGASTGTICATANEGGSLTLTAPAGAVITAINFASYGTPNGSCGNFTMGGCNAANSMSIVAGYALGKNSVVIPANNAVFGDPCYGTYKRLYVQATYILAGAGSSLVNSLDYTCANTGNNTVILQAKDAYGNTSIASAMVTVKDVTPATVITQNITVNLDAAGNAGITPAMINNGSNDNCGIASLSLDKTSFNCSNVGDNTVTLTVIDVHGNVSSATATVTVKDLVPANVITQNIRVNLDAAGNAGITPAMINNGSNDNCGIASLSLDKTSFNCSNAGDNTVTLTVTDVHGNVSSATATVTVKDLVPATVITQNITVNLDAAGNASITPAMIDNGSNDNCGIASLSLDKTSFNCSNVGDNTVTLTVTDVHGNVSSATATVTVKDLVPPSVTAPANQVFCANANGTNSYTVPAAANIADNCSVATITYSVTGPVNRTGTGADASGAFGIGNSVITWTVTDVNGNSTSVSSNVTINPLPVATFTSSNADAFCNSVTLTGSSSINAASYSWSSVNAAGSFSSSPQLNLGLTNADGNYYLYVKVNATGCVSATAAVYNYQKQNLVSSYTLLAYKEVELGKYNKVNTGSVGVMTARGEAEFKATTSVNGPGAFVKAPKIDKDGSGIQIPVQIIGMATVTLPTMQYNTAVTNNLPGYTASVNNATVAGNFKNLNVKKGISITVTGNTFGNIRLEEGASIRFTSSALNIENFTADKGWKNTDYSYIRFAPNTSVRVSNKMSLGSQVYFNPEANKVTVYMGDNRNDEEKFTVKGGDTRVIANVFMPDGKLRVTATDSDDDGHDNCDHKAHNAKDCKHKGHDHNDCDHKGHAASNCSDDVYMTGLFIAEEIESKGNTVIWNSYDCAAPPAPVTMLNTTPGKQATATAETVETKTTTTEEVLKVTVMPNPSTTYFTLKLESRSAEPVNMKIMDGSGRVIEARSKLASNGTAQVGHNYSSGTYYAELIQGTTRKVIQLIKGRG